MKFNHIAIVGLSLFALSCNDKKQSKAKTMSSEAETVEKPSAPTFQNKGHQLVYAMVEKVGNYASLKNKKDVVYDYKYATPDGKADISTEKYIFDGELSYGEYNQHQRTLPELKGTLEQGYDGKEFWLKHNGELVKDTAAIKRITFSRQTNFYWFTMFQKMLDPSLNYEYLGEKNIDDKNYDIVKVSFESKNEKPTDTYQLYINKESGLVDQFLFTVVDFGVIEKPLLMQVEYEKVEDMMIPSKRKYKPSTWDADVTDKPWIEVTWSNISFGNGLKVEDFKK